jgi:hypothetical protein
MLGAQLTDVPIVPRGPYASLLGAAYGTLDPMVRRAHEAPLSARGTLTVEHGDRWWTPLMVRAMRLPVAGPAQPVRLEVAASGSHLAWLRQIGSSPLHTVQFADGSRLVERSGPGRVSFELAVHDGALVYRQFAIEVFGVRVPEALAPRVVARVSPDADGWRVSVEVTWRGGLVCRYAGIMRPA